MADFWDKARALAGKRGYETGTAPLKNEEPPALQVETPPHKKMRMDYSAKDNQKLRMPGEQNTTANKRLPKKRR